MRAKPQISIRHIGEIAIFDITGYLTEDSGEDMDTAYEQIKTEGSTKILLNFDQKSFITSSGFGLIVKLLWKTRSKRQILRVAHPSEQVRKTFSIIGLTRSIDVFPSESEALADF
ncbi:STAS domain-containing protein [Candidatus Poribacteria bacterium]|nr:STAS domain-containing protein [Candidatus Poribacteria bacterium]